MFKTVVEAHGHDVELAFTGKEGLDKHTSTPFDVLAVDYQLPDMTGVDVCRKLLLDNPDLPIVMVTGKGNQRLVVEAMGMGVSQYVVKDDLLVYTEFLPSIINGLLARNVEKQLIREANENLDKKTRELNLLNSALDEHAIVSIADAQGIITYVNDKFCDISGYSREELLGENHRILRSDEHSRDFYKDLWTTIANGKTWSGEIKNLSKSGEYYWVAATIVPSLNEAGKPFEYVAIRTDITSNKLAVKALHESEELQRGVFNNTPSVIYIKDLEGKYIFVNRKFSEILNISSEQVIGKTDHDFLPHDIADNVRKNDLKIIALDKPNESEEIVPLDDGPHTYISSKFALKNIEGKIYATCGISNDITARKIAETKLIEAKAEADAANNAKSDFLSSMSHELRTPMNAILGFGQMLDFNPKEPLSVSQKDSVDQIMKGGQHLLELINDILDLAQIEAGKVEMSIEDIDPNDAVEECLSLTIGMADSRGIDISSPDVTPEPQNIKADYTRFKQVLLNLMSNAIKYNRDNGKVRISLEPTPQNMLRINLTDTGAGIPDERQSEMFKPFSRLGAENSEIEGTGIGLVVCKDLVELMGGTIGFESHIGIGSWFWFELPLSPPQAVTSDAVIKEAEGRGQLQAINGTMLYVEDNPSNLQLMEMIVSRIDGLTMLSAHTAELGIDIAIANNPDIIILDINLPGMSGLDAIKELKKYDATKDIPTMALSAAATRSDIEKGLEAGFLQYLTKPMNVVEVTDAIREALKTGR